MVRSFKNISISIGTQSILAYFTDALSVKIELMKLSFHFNSITISFIYLFSESTINSLCHQGWKHSEFQVFKKRFCSYSKSNCEFVNLKQ